MVARGGASEASRGHILRERTTADALLRSPVSQQPVLIFDGTDEAGDDLRRTWRPLRDVLALDTKTSNAFWTVILSDVDSPFCGVQGGIADWRDHLQGSTPPLLQDAFGLAPDQYLATYYFFNVGRGKGAAYHDHERSLFFQARGINFWRIFPPAQFARDYRDPEVGYTLGNPSAIKKEHDDMLYERPWNLQRSSAENVAEPIEFFTEADDIVYLPEGWVHATFKESAASVTMVQIPKPRGQPVL